MPYEFPAAAGAQTVAVLSYKAELGGAPVAKKRIPVTKATVAALRVASANRCCVCRNEREGQVHHIDGDPSNGIISNLAFLCLICHSQASQRGGFGRHLDAHTIRAFRDQWHDLVARSNDLDGMLSKLGRPDALKDAVASVEVWRIGVEIEKLDIVDERIAERVGRLHDYARSFGGPAVLEVLRVLYVLVARTRHGMPASTAESVASVALEATPIVRFIDPAKGLTEPQATRFGAAVEIAFGLAYDGVLYLKDPKVVHAGARLLRHLLASAGRHPQQCEEANDGFTRALEAAARSKLPLGGELLRFERAEASEAGAVLLDYSDDLLEFVGLADIAREQRAARQAETPASPASTSADVPGTARPAPTGSAPDAAIPA